MRIAVTQQAAFLAVLALASTAAAQQRRPPVELAPHGLFGDELLMPNAISPISVEARNRTRSLLRGRLIVELSSFTGSRARHEIPLDLPPGETRRALLAPFVPQSANIEVRYEVDDRVLSRTSLSPAYSATSTGVVVLADPPRLRAALIDVEVQQTDIGPYATPRMVRFPIGTVAFDARSGDPILPTDAQAWASIELLVAYAPDLERVGQRERRALADWVTSGGQVLIFLRSEADLRGPAVRELAGDDVRQVDPDANVDPAELARRSGLTASGIDPFPLVPDAIVRRTLAGTGVRGEEFGGSARRGFGRVYVATYDGMAPPHAHAPETRELVRAVLSLTPRYGLETPIFPQGKNEDDLGGGLWAGPGTFGTLRAALDPNEGYRPALALVGIVLLLYVFVVGPVNFFWVLRKNKPTLALLTTPGAAAGCLVLLLGVGYLGKGIRTRYSSIEIVEVIDGDTAGPARRYSALFPTRPLRWDWTAPERGVVRHISSAAGDARPWFEHGGDSLVLRDMSARLWETTFIREDRVADLGGPIVIERANGRISAVRNETPLALRAAIVVDPMGNVFPLGALPSGGRAMVPAASSGMVATGQAFWGEEDPQLALFTTQLGLDGEHREIVDGVSKLLNGTFATATSPTVIAVYEADRGNIGLFGRELDLVFVRVVPDTERQEEGAP